MNESQGNAPGSPEEFQRAGLPVLRVGWALLSALPVVFGLL